MRPDPGVNAMRYRAYGLTLISDAPLHELVPVTEAETEAKSDVRICFSSCRNRLPTPSHWFMSWTLPTGELWLSCAKDDQGYLLRFPDLADFFVDSDGHEIICHAGAETPRETLRHLLLDQVLPLVLNLKGRQALHATATLTPLGVCAFTGRAGAGKSTLAASFLRAGYPVLSDDCLVLREDSGRIFATPAYPGLRLWEDALGALCEDADAPRPVAHYTSKQRLIPHGDLGEFPSGHYPLIGIYCLVRPTEMDDGSALTDPLIERLSCRDGFIELIPSVFRLDITDRTMLARQFRFLQEIVSHVPIRRLRLPNAFSSLAAVREAIIADLKDE
jgi:hypothetical protein